jgi:hypothetical protein
MTLSLLSEVVVGIKCVWHSENIRLVFLDNNILMKYLRLLAINEQFSVICQNMIISALYGHHFLYTFCIEQSLSRSVA